MHRLVSQSFVGVWSLQVLSRSAERWTLGPDGPCFIDALVDNGLWRAEAMSLHSTRIGVVEAGQAFRCGEGVFHAGEGAGDEIPGPAGCRGSGSRPWRLEPPMWLPSVGKARPFGHAPLFAVRLSPVVSLGPHVPGRE